MLCNIDGKMQKPTHKLEWFYREPYLEKINIIFFNDHLLKKFDYEHKRQHYKSICTLWVIHKHNQRDNKAITIRLIENTFVQLWTLSRMNIKKDNSKQNKKLTNNKINKTTTMVQAQLVSDGAI